MQSFVYYQRIIWIGGDDLANSSIIPELKEKVILEIINDEDIVAAINSSSVSDISDAYKLVNKHLFRYNQNPLTLNEAITYLTFQVHIPEISYYRGSTKSIYVLPRLEIWIISHEKCMLVDNIPKITDNRNDYISKLIDKKFNGRSRIGLESSPLNLLGKLQLVLNDEGAFQKNYLYRRMIFETRDFNNSLCDKYD